MDVPAGSRDWWAGEEWRGEGKGEGPPRADPKDPREREGESEA